MKFDTSELKAFIQKLEETQANIDSLCVVEVNRITDRHLARIKENTAVGDSPDSPSLRNAWDRSRVHVMADGIYSEVFNTMKYAPFYEYGHRQEPGRIVFIELAPGQQKYGQSAIETKDGRWGIFIRLKQPFVKGAFVMTDSEAIAQKELDAACRRIERKIKRSLE